MKKLDKLIIKAFVGPFVITFFVTLFVLVMQFLWKWIDDLVGKGLDAFTVGKLLFYMSATMVPLALPLAILLSSIMTFGNLGENFELVALKSAGISLTRFMRPLIILCLFICGGAFLFSNYVIPAANLQADSLLYDIVNLKHGFNIRPGIFFSEIDNMAIKVQRKSADGVTIYGVMIYDSRDPLNKKLILAKSGKMEESEDKKFVYLILKDGWEYEERGNRSMDNNEFVRSSFKEFREVIDLSSFALSRTPIDLFKTSYQMLNVGQLTKAIDSIQTQLKFNLQTVTANMNSRYAFSRWGDTGWLKTQPPPLKVAAFDSLIAPNQLGYVYDRVKMNLKEISNNMGLTVSDYDQRVDSIVRHKIEWQRKFTLSFACMVLFLIGAPLGSIIRKGGLGTPLVFAVAFFVVFHVISTIGERLARNNVLTPGGGMWMATVILTPIAGFLVYKALNDSQLFNQEFYFRLLRDMRRLLPWKKTIVSTALQSE
ncbi:MAG: YjgP/YjgQ family permease [Chitinophagaceae bacterium]|nr:MAG: YjgP/YjgQ family permease [Chitinophagaceae bacterium]